jgi:hypothetical protein
VVCYSLQVRPSLFVDPSPSWGGDLSIAIPADIKRPQIADHEKEQQERKAFDNLYYYYLRLSQMTS